MLTGAAMVGQCPKRLLGQWIRYKTLLLYTKTGGPALCYGRSAVVSSGCRMKKMIEYTKHILDNGMVVLTHESWDTPFATTNLLYGVGARNEDPQRTGFAHLFEHLMFGGTPQVPDFDRVVSGLGGESNAFTNNDYTDYYITLPVEGLRTALVLEADRMAHLDISQRALEVQQHVVTEEYNQRYINQPYGDVWLLLRPLCYTVHPYRWATIGADIRHVSEATLEDVRDFHQRWYRPQNAILAVAAPMAEAEQLRLVESAFGSFENADRCWKPMDFGAVEPVQTARREQRVTRQVPASMVYVAWPMCDRFDPRFRWCDLLSDVLGNGMSSRLYSRLVREEQIMTEADACITGDAGQGLLVLNGKMAPGHTTAEGIEALRSEAYRLTAEAVDEYELQKVVNKYENTFVYSQYKAADRALSLCYYTWLGDTDLVNSEPEQYRKATSEALLGAARDFIRPEHENILYYEAD